MKRGITPFIFITVVCIAFLFPLLNPYFYISHDGEAHVARFAAYYQAYTDGQFPARWAGGLNQDFGSPVLIFYYPLPGTLASLIHSFGINFEESFKILMAVSFVLSPISFYLWISRKVRKDVAIMGGLLYGLAPYHFLNTYVRGDIAEMMALALTPLVFLFIDKITKKAAITTIVFGSLTYALLILSHNAVSLMFSFAIFGYTLLQFFKRGGDKQLIYQYTSILVLGLGLSAFFWIPALYESRFTNASLFVGNMFREHFPPASSLIYSSWGFGPDVNKAGGLSPQIGPLHVGIVFLGTILMFIKRKFDRELLFWLFVFVGTVFLTISISTFLWERLPLLKLFQFPWRWTALSSFTASIIIVLTFNTFYSKRLLLIVAMLILISSLPFVKVERFVQARGDNYYASYKGTTDYHGQASTIWTEGDAGQTPSTPIETIQGKARISDKKRKSNKHTFVINAGENTRVLDNTVYFPGWQARVDNKKVPIEFQDINYRGFITFNVPKDLHKVEVKFMESPIRLLSDIISLIGLTMVLVMFVTRERLNKVLVKL